MATDLKISQMPNDSTPLAGTELLPLVQGGSNVKATVDGLFAYPANLPAFSLVAPVLGTEPVLTMQNASNVQITTGQLFTLILDYPDIASGNPLDGTLSLLPVPIALKGGNAFSGTTNAGGAISLTCGDGDGSGNGGAIALTSGGTTTGVSGAVTVASAAASAASSGAIAIATGAASGSGKAVGNITLTLGAATSSASAGHLIFSNINASDPSVTGAVYKSNGFLLVSGANTTQRSAVASGSAVSLGTGTAANITNIVLPAGKWRISASAYFIAAATTTVTRVAASFSTSTGTMGTAAGAFGNQYLADDTGTNIGQDIAVTGIGDIVTPGSTTTYFLVAKSTFSTSTMTAYGVISAVPVAQ